jgi:hypothetical protein
MHRILAAAAAVISSFLLSRGQQSHPPLFSFGKKTEFAGAIHERF